MSEKKAKNLPDMIKEELLLSLLENVDEEESEPMIRVKRGSEKCKTTKRSSSNNQKQRNFFKRSKQEHDRYGGQAGRITSDI